MEKFMTQNAPQNEDAAQKKRFPFLTALLAVLIAAGIAVTAYFAIFPNQKIPFLSEKTEQQSNTLVPSTSADINKEENQTASEEEQNSNYLKANEIFERLTPPKQNDTAENSAAANGEDNLNIVDMTPAAQNSQTEQNNSDEFSLQPPSTVTPLESGRKMLTEEEIKEAQEKDRQEKLARLETLRQNNTALSEQEKDSLPTRQGTLSNLVPNADFDPVVTVFFIQDLAEYLVKNYKTAADGTSCTAVTMPKLNQRYGVGLYGLEHAKGRQGVLEYAYNSDMIPALYKFLSPLLLQAMEQTANLKDMPLPDQMNMFACYADLSALYAEAVRELVNMPQLAENLQNLHAIEQSLKEEEKYFADNLLGFEQNRENKKIARTFEQNIKQSTIRTEQLRSRLKTVKNDLKHYLANYSASLASVPDVLELALWIDRRKNSAATNAFADALEQFSQDLINYHAR